MSKKKTKFFASTKRSLAKSTTYRVLNILADVVVVYALTHRYDLTAGLVIITNITSTVLYFTHERIWNHIHWGKYQR